MSKWVSTIRRVCHVLFLYELKVYTYVLFCWCHDPPRSPKTLSAGQGPDIRTDVRTRYPARELGHRTGRPTPNDRLVQQWKPCWDIWNLRLGVRSRVAMLTSDSKTWLAAKFFGSPQEPATQSRQHCGSTIFWRNLPPYHRILYFVVSFYFFFLSLHS